MTLFIYRFIINIIFILSPIVILIRVFQNKEDIKRFKEKLCLFTKKKSKKKLIWFHGASVGEISSIIPIVQILERNKKIENIKDYIINILINSMHKISDISYTKPKIHIYLDYCIRSFDVLSLSEKKKYIEISYNISKKNIENYLQPIK